MNQIRITKTNYFLVIEIWYIVWFLVLGIWSLPQGDLSISPRDVIFGLGVFGPCKNVLCRSIF
jgi:hypothetical protein